MAKPLRVLHLLVALDDSRGGPVTFLKQVVRSADHDRVTHAAIALQGTCEVSFPGLPVSYAGRGWRTLPQWIKHVAKASRACDVVHIHGLFSWHLLLGAWMALRTPRPCVVNTHGNLHPQALRHRGWLKKLYLRWVLRQILRRAAALLATGEVEREFIQRAVPGAKVVIVQPAVELPPFQRQPGTTDLPLELAFVGRIHPHKHLDLLLAALSDLERHGIRANLKVLGDGTPSYEHQLRRLVNQLNLTDRVDWLGHVDPTQVPRYLTSCDALILPSRSENFSFATAEAMAVGVAVVISDQVGLAGLVHRYEAGWVFTAGDRRALVAALCEAVSPAERDRRGLNGRACVQAELGLEPMGQSLQQLYKTVALRG